MSPTETGVIIMLLVVMVFLGTELIMKIWRG
jgi:hypothetical protein